EKLLAAVEIDKNSKCLVRLTFRQQDLYPIFQVQIPASFADQHRGLGQLCNRRKTRDDIKEVASGLLRAFADHERQRGETRRYSRFKDGTVSGDECDAAVSLPEGKWLALLDLDTQSIRIQFKDGRILDPRIGHQACASESSIQK